MLYFKKSKGFTLIELLLVIGIIALLTSLVLVLLSGTRAQGRDSKRKAETDSLRKALALYYADYGTYPTTTSWVSIEDTSKPEVAVLRSKLQPYLPIPPTDPLYGNMKSASVPYSYQYMSTTTGTGEIAYKLHVELETGIYASYETYSDGGGGITYGTEPPPPPFSCGDLVNFTYKGSSVTYGTVLSTGTECWMDRNLGADQVAVNATDTLAYGDLFQWGRLSDLHQNRNSGVTTTLSITDNPNHSNFITTDVAPDDWRSPQNNNLWQGVSGINNPCPSGWRLPTFNELNTERASWSQQNWNGAFASLKLTAGGYRDYNYYNYGSLYDVGSFGLYWSSTVDGTLAYYLLFGSSDAYLNHDYRAIGFSVRCLKD